MRSKTNRKKAASQRQGKAVLYLKRGLKAATAVTALAALTAVTYFLLKEFYVREIQVQGNEHLEKSDVEYILNIRREPLLNLSLVELDEKLKGNAWIRKASLRWQLPGTLLVNIEESSPKALLDSGGVMYLVNEKGDLMERLDGQATPFLPVIKGIDPRFKKDMAEAMKLVEALAVKNIIAERQFIEIGKESIGLTANIDGEYIRVGYGQYEDKFRKWLELEPELKRRGVPIEYIDLRFKDSVIVKPLLPEKSKGSEKMVESGNEKKQDRLKLRSGKDKIS